jgi:hypothetical protein
MRRVLKQEKGSKFFIRSFTDRPVTARAAETRMGKGKGNVEYFATWVSKGRVVLEVRTQRQDLAMKVCDFYFLHMVLNDFSYSFQLGSSCCCKHIAAPYRSYSHC